METFKSHPTAPSFPKLPEYKRSLGNRILQCSALSALYLNPLVGIHIFNMRRRAIPLVADAKGYAQNLDCTNCETFAAIGDSIIRGVGAKSEESIPGVLSTTMPEVKMENCLTVQVRK